MLIFERFLPLYRAFKLSTARRHIFRLQRTAASWVFSLRCNFERSILQICWVSLHLMGLKIGGTEANMVSFRLSYRFRTIALLDFEERELFPQYQAILKLPPLSTFCLVLYDGNPLIFEPFLPRYKAFERLTARSDIFHLRRTAASWIFSQRRNFEQLVCKVVRWVYIPWAWNRRSGR